MSGSKSGAHSEGCLQVEVEGSVAIVRINRPEKLNAMARPFWSDLRTVISRLEADPQVRAAVITGAGDKAFSVGGDIASFTELEGLEEKRRYQAEVMSTFIAVEEADLPLIAAVHGYALGGGCELALACDLVLASENALFGMPESALGLVPGFGVLRAPDVIGRQMTKLLVMSGEKIDAEEALACGLVQRLVRGGDVLEEAVKLAEKIAANSPLALRVGKRIINRGIDRTQFDYSVEALTVLQSSKDTAEGVSAFLERRKPVFSP